MRAYKIPVRVYKTQLRAYTKAVNLFSEDRELPDDKFDGHHGHHSSLGRHVDLSHYPATLRTSRLSQRRSEMRMPIARASCPKIRLTNALGFVVPSVRLRQGMANAPAKLQTVTAIAALGRGPDMSVLSEAKPQHYAGRNTSASAHCVVRECGYQMGVGPALALRCEYNEALVRSRQDVHNGSS